MKTTYGGGIPSGYVRMSQELEAFYDFYDSDNESVCYEFDSDRDAKRAYGIIFGAVWRRELQVDVKKIGNRIYAKKKLGKAVIECTDR